MSNLRIVYLDGSTEAVPDVASCDIYNGLLRMRDANGEEMGTRENVASVGQSREAEGG